MFYSNHQVEFFILDLSTAFFLLFFMIYLHFWWKAIESGRLPGDILDDIPCKYIDGALICEVSYPMFKIELLLIVCLNYNHLE